MTEGRLLSAEELENALAMVVCVDDRAALVALGDIRAHIAALSRPAKDVGGGLVADLVRVAVDLDDRASDDGHVGMAAAADWCATLREAAAALTALAREKEAMHEALVASRDALEVLRRGHGADVSAACFPALNLVRACLSRAADDKDSDT